MRRKSAKLGRAVQRFGVLLTCGALTFAFGGCLRLDLDRLLRFGAAVAATEFVLDNDGVFDLFPDGAAVGG